MDAPEKKTFWLLRVRVVMVLLTIFGPLALPLVWASPRFTMKWKIWTTVVTVFLALLFLFVLGAYIEDVKTALLAARGA